MLWNDNIQNITTYLTTIFKVNTIRGSNIK